MLTSSLGPGVHVCHIYRNPGDQNALVLPFCRDGLMQEECCLLTATPDLVNDWQLELQANGIDVQEGRETGALQIKALRGPAGDFSAVRQARDLWRMVEPLLDRFTSVRMLRDQPWAPGLALTIEDLCQFEVVKHLLFQDTSVRNVCQYDLTNHPPAAIHTALRTHPLVILDGTLHDNQFFEGPAILANEPSSFSSDAGAETVASMLARFQ